VRPTWALIDEAIEKAEHANTNAIIIVGRREGGDKRLARQAAEAFKRGARLLAMVEREDEDPLRPMPEPGPVERLQSRYRGGGFDGR
jgi:hypothetical protein